MVPDTEPTEPPVRHLSASAPAQAPSAAPEPAPTEAPAPGATATTAPNVEVIDISKSRGTGTVEEVTGMDRLNFARTILFFLFLITLMVFGCYILAPENKGAAAVFELVKVGVLPLVTLVIGFYFPSSNSK